MLATTFHTICPLADIMQTQLTCLSNPKFLHCPMSICQPRTSKICAHLLIWCKNSRLASRTQSSSIAPFFHVSRDHSKCPLANILQAQLTWLSNTNFLHSPIFPCHPRPSPVGAQLVILCKHSWLGYQTQSSSRVPCFHVSYNLPQ